MCIRLLTIVQLLLSVTVYEVVSHHGVHEVVNSGVHEVVNCIFSSHYGVYEVN